MVTIKCSANILEKGKLKTLDDLDFNADISSFPQGELELSIYKDPNLTNSNIIFKGVEVKNGTEINDLDFSTDEINFTTSVYTPTRTGTTSIAQTIYNNPAYFKSVKQAFEKQYCPIGTTNKTRVDINRIKSFVAKYCTIQSVQLLKDNDYVNMVQMILFSNAAPAEAILRSNKLNLFDKENIKKKEDRINEDFYATILSLKEIEKSRVCSDFERTGIIPEGLILHLDLSAIANDGRDIPVVPVQSNKPYKNLYDSISSNSSVFVFNEHRFNIENSKTNNLVFRHTAGDTKYELYGKEGVANNTRVNSDIRFKDYQVNQKNIKGFEDLN